MIHKLNLGSYIYPREGYVNVDIEDFPGVDIKHDLNRVPWPFPDDCFDFVRAVDIIEHLGELTKVEIVNEIARITKPAGAVHIRVPNVFHHNALASLQHAHAFFINSFEPSYAQPHFRVIGVWAILPYRFPYRELIRFMLRRGWIETIEFTLIKKGETL